MIVLRTIVFAHLLLLFGFISGSDLPKHFPRCFRNDPPDVLGKCLVKAANQVKPYLIKGVPQLNIKPISEIMIDEVNLKQGTDAVNLEAFLKNLTLIGLDTYVFKRFDFNVENLTFFNEVVIGRIDVDGEYSANGKILMIPIQGKGHFHASFSHANATVHVGVEEIQNNGVTYLTTKTIKVDIELGDVLEHEISGLFQDSEVLEKAVQDVINDNTKEVIAEVKPAVENVVSIIIVNILHKTVDRVPYDKLYPLRT